MLRWGPYPFLRIALFFGGGIITYLQLGQKPGFIFPLLAFLFLLYLVSWRQAARRRSRNWNNLAGLAGLSAMGLLGLVHAHYHTAKVRADNLLHHSGPVSHYMGVIDEYIARKPGSQVTVLAVSQVKTGNTWKPASGRVRLVLMQPDKFLAYGDVLLVKGAPSALNPPGNPHQFDYRQYLAQKQVYHQQYLYSSQYLKIGQAPASLLVAASIQTRDFFDLQLRRYIDSPETYGIATALVLGIRDYLPEDIKTTYANSGTMHVLAVSGLHVALLFLVLNLLLGRLGQRPAMRLLSFLLLMGFIWFYAFITALSASVLRAVVMFSFIQVARTFRLPSNIYNTLAAAAFGLLLYNPYFLVEVGFQLSFLAVYGIVYLQPRIYRWLMADSRAGDYLWKLVSTSLAAQLAVLPLSFYYFHQFPVYFLLANIVAVTLTNVVLLVGFGVLAFCWWPAVAGLLGWGIQVLLQAMNYISQALVQLPGAVISGIVLSPGQAWLLYGLLLLLVLFLLRRRLSYLAGFTGLVLVFSALEVVQARHRQKQQMLVVYQVRGATALAFIQQRRAVLLADSAFYAHPRFFRYQVQPHWWQLGIEQMQLDTLQLGARPGLANRQLADGNMLLAWQGLRLLVCYKPPGAYRLQDLDLDYLVLTRNVKLAPERLPNKKGRLQVILDDSNKKWYQNKWNAQLKARHLRVYLVNRQGAYIRMVD